jgi:hypothetical protein
MCAFWGSLNILLRITVTSSGGTFCAPPLGISELRKGLGMEGLIGTSEDQTFNVRIV